MYNDKNLNSIEKLYWTREVGEILDIKEGTVRKYARLMESNGYTFHRNENEQRGFFERDVMVMKRIQALSKTKGVTLEDAVRAVLNDLPEKSTELVTQTVTALPDEVLRHMMRYEVMFNSIQDLHNDLQELHNDNEELKKDRQELKRDNQELKELVSNVTEQVKQQKDYIEESIKRRDEALTQLMREIQEEKQKEIEKEKEKEAEKKKGFWARLFGSKE